MERIEYCAKRLLHRVVSVSLFIKIVGMGVLVAIIFSSLMVYHTRRNMHYTLYEFLEEKALFNAILLATSIEQPMLIDDFFSVHQHLQMAMSFFPYLRYVIVEDHEGKIVAHTFSRSVPSSLLRIKELEALDRKTAQVLKSPEGNILEVRVLLLHGKAGRLRLGVLDKIVREQLAIITKLLLGALTLCSILVIALALILTYILTRPIHNLLEATEQIRRGQFQHRAKLFWGDEFGNLAEAFNQMAASLENYQSQVLKKEAERLCLIEKIVSAQEEERKTIGRELHDQIGQSLLALLLNIQRLTSNEECPCVVGKQLEEQIQKILDEARHLAWGMHPSILDDYGLDHALKHYVKVVSQRFGIIIDYQYMCPPELEALPAQMKINLYRIAQEALTNIGRHARANRVSIVLLRSHTETLLLVEDDGMGFDLHSLKNDSVIHLGLLGMRERTALLGGEFLLESNPNCGTTIRVKIPMTNRS
jgi:signal transduction histidine kinase